MGVLIIVISAIRMDLTFTGLLTVATTMSVALASATGPVPMQSPSAATARVWSFCVVLAGVTLILRALLAGRMRTAGAGLEVRVVAPAAMEIPPEAGRNLYRIAQEALNNVLKHSHARVVTLRLAPCTLEGGRPGVRLGIEDDGIGLAGPAAPDGPSAGLEQRTAMAALQEATGSRVA